MTIALQNISPPSGAMGIADTADIQADIVRAVPPLTLAEIEIYVEGELAFVGSDPSPFRGQYAGPGSSVTPIADGFRVVLDRLSPFRAEFINTQVRQTDGYVSSPAAGWSFRVGADPVSDFYFSDGYGVRRLHVRQLVGEWKPYENAATDGYAMPVILAEAMTPEWPSDNVRTLAGSQVDGYLHLVASTEKGVALTTGETGNLRVYAKPEALVDGYDSLAAHMTSEGTLYLINRTLNRLEVYYGANFRSPLRQPDFWYGSGSSPPLLDGYLTALHVAEGESTVLDGGSRLYVGCSEGMTKIEAYDKQTDGYSEGMDGYILGGSVAAVVAIDSDEPNGVLFVATNDGTETGGGLSQISISRNVRLLFMTKESGHLPSNVVKDIAV